MSIINSKTIARIAAVQALYQYKFNESKESLENKNIDQIIQQIEHLYISGDMNDEFGRDLKNSKIKLHKSFFKEIFSHAVQNIDEIDKRIMNHLSKEWTIENLHDNLKAILRCGICEIVFFREVPYKVVINEYTNIASEMLKENEVGFINSILDAINKEVRSTKDLS